MARGKPRPSPPPLTAQCPPPSKPSPRPLRVLHPGGSPHSKTQDIPATPSTLTPHDPGWIQLRASAPSQQAKLPRPSVLACLLPDPLQFAARAHTLSRLLPENMGNGSTKDSKRIPLQHQRKGGLSGRPGGARRGAQDAVIFGKISGKPETKQGENF